MTNDITKMTKAKFEVKNVPINTLLKMKYGEKAPEFEIFPNPYKGIDDISYFGEGIIPLKSVNRLDIERRNNPRNARFSKSSFTFGEEENPRDLNSSIYRNSFNLKAAEEIIVAANGIEKDFLFVKPKTVYANYLKSLDELPKGLEVSYLEKGQESRKYHCIQGNRRIFALECLSDTNRDADVTQYNIKKALDYANGTRDFYVFVIDEEFFKKYLAKFDKYIPGYSTACYYAYFRAGNNKGESSTGWKMETKTMFDTSFRYGLIKPMIEKVFKNEIEAFAKDFFKKNNGKCVEALSLNSAIHYITTLAVNDVESYLCSQTGSGDFSKPNLTVLEAMDGFKFKDLKGRSATDKRLNTTFVKTAFWHDFYYIVGDKYGFESEDFKGIRIGIIDLINKIKASIADERNQGNLSVKEARHMGQIIDKLYKKGILTIYDGKEDFDDYRVKLLNTVLCEYGVR